MRITVTVDGTAFTDEVEPRLLVHYLRDRLGKVGTVVGCDTSNCGACTVHLNGYSVKSCAVLAVQADGGDVLTVEGLSRDGTLHPIQEAFRDNHVAVRPHRHDHADASTCSPRTRSGRGNGAARPGRQHVPLHRYQVARCRMRHSGCAVRRRRLLPTMPRNPWREGRNRRGRAMTATAEPEIGKARGARRTSI